MGPNGAGKTTSLSTGVGLLRPDEGAARIFGVDVWADPTAAKELVGVLPDGLAMPERLTDREVLSYLGLLRGLDQATVGQRADELLEVLELAGSAAFTAASLLAAFSPSARMLITSRALLGFASATLMPSCQSLARSMCG